MASLLRETRRLLFTHGLRPKKRWGQCFLIDRNILEKILEAGELRAEDQILEIGPGVGTLTTVFAERSGRVVAVEIDPKLFQILHEVLGDKKHVVLLQRDILDLDLEPLLRGGRWKVIANLPYYIATPILTRLLMLHRHFSLLLLMVQQEVAERLRASPGEKGYSSLTVLCQYHADVHMMAKISRNAFYPTPQVDSALVRLRVLPKPRVRPRDPALYFRLVRAAFAYRRKTLPNALARAGWIPMDRPRLEAVLERAGIDPHRRGETLTLQEFQEVADQLLTCMEGAPA
jgi:16S rRNA (adenine1518-N6/adenine1519-N6)-dimethyltransferase